MFCQSTRVRRYGSSDLTMRERKAEKPQSLIYQYLQALVLKKVFQILTFALKALCSRDFRICQGSQPYLSRKSHFSY
jgi:hypothetical protein